MDPLLLFIVLPVNRGLVGDHPLTPGERAAQRIQPSLQRTMKRPTAAAWRSRSVVAAIPVAWSQGRAARSPHAVQSPVGRRVRCAIRDIAIHERFRRQTKQTNLAKV